MCDCTVVHTSLCLLLAGQTGLWLETNKTTTRQNWEELEASLAPAEAEVGAMAKADQQQQQQQQKQQHQQQQK